ncbi:4'-phosphopantetheinyl transferase [Bacillus sp. J14TS2]|uniref:4'-phosphopantetheinyl transferase family protein n=1 Tax=Bacillus sp. J14TS2 TaxID=2807188 RepID=UPI001B25D7F8|nr:4'-phosphopantetheinyl transferase superfamily protein [Bacillus sp. J14TS2]GIN72147.1 4'-phosphopantetheinyl transferase [Bacillus sp. J14TS2]
MVEVYICKLPEKTSQEELKVLLAQASYDRQKRIRQFFHLEDAYRTIIGDLLLDNVLKERTGARLKDITVEKNAYGKPFLPNYPHIQYNISHSGNYVVCAVHNQHVGIDVEKVQVFDLCMAKQLFTAFEYRDILNSKNRILACYEIWTLKESYVKALGKGLAIPLHSFRVRKSDNNEIEVVDMDKNEKVLDYMYKQYTLDTDYKLAVCAQDAEKSDFVEYPCEVRFDILSERVN